MGPQPPRPARPRRRIYGDGVPIKINCRAIENHYNALITHPFEYPALHLHRRPKTKRQSNPQRLSAILCCCDTPGTPGCHQSPSYHNTKRVAFIISHFVILWVSNYIHKNLFFYMVSTCRIRHLQHLSYHRTVQTDQEQ